MVLHRATWVTGMVVLSAFLLIVCGSNVLALASSCCPVQLCAAGSVEKGKTSSETWLGVCYQGLGSELREALNIGKGVDGVLISCVYKGSPAEKAGMKKGDILVALDESGIAKESDLVRLVGKRKPGDRVSVKLVREGSKKTVRVTLGSRPEKPKACIGGNVEKKLDLEIDELGSVRLRGLDDDIMCLGVLPELGMLTMAGKGVRFGVEIADLNEQLREYFGVEGGVLVLNVTEGSAAERAGIKAGDIITGVGKTRVSDPSGLRELVRKYDAGDEVEIAVVRKGKALSLRATLEKGPGVIILKEGKATKRPREYGTARARSLPEGNELLSREELRETMHKLEREIERLREELGQIREELEDSRN
ncbi:MAG: PDZ domain-containing protein [Candidatus Eisenbacteria bacterium]